MDDSVFTEAEYQELIRFAVGRNGATKQQIALFISRFEDMKTSEALLRLLRAGKVEVTGYTEDDFHIGLKQ